MVGPALTPAGNAQMQSERDPPPRATHGRRAILRSLDDAVVRQACQTSGWSVPTALKQSAEDFLQDRLASADGVRTDSFLFLGDHEIEAVERLLRHVLVE